VGKLTSVLAALAATITLGTAPAVLLAPPAQAADATPGCITKSEFRAVTKGTTLSRATRIIGATGRTTSSSHFSDGDGWRTVEFRQCRRTWSRSSVFLDFEKTEREVYVEDWYCDSWGCEDWGYWETRYSTPYRMTSKWAYWS
jgi:hypothetical protein